MNQRAVRCVAVLVLAAFLVAAVSGCAARTLIDAVADGLPSPSTEAEVSGLPAQTASDPETAAPAAGSDISIQPAEEPLSQEVATGRLVPFPDMVYVRPDTDSVVAQLNVLANNLRTQSDADTVSELVEQANDLYDDFETETVLAMIHNCMDRSDPYWQAEYSYCSSGMPRINQAYTEVSVALEQSPAGRAAGIESEDNLFEASGIMDLLSEHTRLINEYQQRLATLTASADGETFTVSEATDAYRYQAWLEQNARTLGELYAQLLRVRYDIARAVGYENYIDYSFSLRDSGFTVEMVQELLDRIARYLAPVDAAVRDTIPEPTLQLSEAVMLQAMGTWMPRLDDSLAESLDIMENYLLYDLSVGANKEPGAFTTYIPSYDAPFLLASYTGSYDAFSDVLHEFGHFNNYALDPSAVTASTDIGEVFSTALVLLCSNFFEDSFGEQEGTSMLKTALADSLSAFPYQAYFVGFELAAYALPPEEITYENLCAISEQQWYRFGEPSSPIAATDWTTTAHLIESPFYVLSYILATDVSMQIWEQSIDNLDGAMDTYYDLMNNSAAGMEFMENITAAGLTSPFSEYEVALQAAYFTACLAANQTPQEARAAHLATLAGGQVPAAETPEQTDAPPAAETPAATPDAAVEPAQPAEPSPEGTEGRYRTFFGYTDGHYTIPLG